MSFKISEICKINSNNISKNDNYDYINYLDTANLNEGSICEMQKLIIDKDKIPSRAKRKIVPDDIIVSTVRPIQKHYGIIKEPIDNMIVSTGFAVLSPDKEKVIPEYLYLYLTQEEITNYLQVIAENSTSAYPSIKPSVIGNLIVDLPEIKQQKAVAKILSTLDDKIETNNQINKTLEEMAQAIFKRWFVDFEFPCLPDGAGKAYDEKELRRVCRYKEVGGLPAPGDGKHFVYVLLCENDSFYIGMTDDLYRRWYEHKTGIGAKWTKAHEPVKVIHHEEFNSREEAATREKELKTGFGRKWLKREYEKLLSEQIAGSPAPNKEYRQAGSLAPNKEDRQAGSLAPNKEDRQAGSLAPNKEDRQAGSPAPKTKLRQAGEMVESELGMIPKGWEVKRVREFADVVGGSTPSKKKKCYYTEKGIPWITPKDLSIKKTRFIGKGEIGITEDGFKNSSTKILKRGAILFSSRAPIGYIAIAKNELTTNQGFKSLVPFDGISNQFIYYMIKHYTPVIENHASGSTFKEISGSAMKEIKFCIPQKDLMEKFHNTIMDFSNIIEKKEEEISILKNIRDTLLPKLMSGEIRVDA